MYRQIMYIVKFLFINKSIDYIAVFLYFNIQYYIQPYFFEEKIVPIYAILHTPP